MSDFLHEDESEEDDDSATPTDRNFPNSQSFFFSKGFLETVFNTRKC